MGAIRTSDGFLVDPFKPLVSDVKPRVHMHSISTINRFTGHACHPYSVGQHTLNLIRVVPKHLRRAALVHDWSESWFNDLASPVKADIPQYKASEHQASRFIAFWMHVPFAELDELDQYDKAIYIDERNALFPIRHDTGMGDDRTGLDMDARHFAETYWRDIREALFEQFRNLFPEYGEF